MFKRKQDVDKHVLSVLNRKKDEKERNAHGYQIARLYLDIKEYETAKRYLANFLQVRENTPQAHQMMGDINEALGKKDLAIENFKRALDLGGFGSSNRQLVLKICELYCDLGTDEQRMKYWLQKCEELFPKSDIVYRMKSQLENSTSNRTGDNSGMERLLLDELLNRPTDLDLRVKLLHLYLDSGRSEEAYDVAVVTDNTMAFVDQLLWYECMMEVFAKYSQDHPEATNDLDFLLMNMHVLRNAVLLSLPIKKLQPSLQLLKTFDQAVKYADGADAQEEAWQAMLKEMKGQLLYLAALALVKRAIMGSCSWQEANQLSGACFLASRSIPPLDAQAPWFVKPEKELAKFYSWWHLQSYDRLSQVARMIHQLCNDQVTQWTQTVHQQVMTGSGHKRVFEALYADASSQEHASNSFFYSMNLMQGKMQEPATSRQLLDIDRVAYQVHLGNLPHLVWLCLQRYSSDMDRQPNYHFSLMENIQFSVKNMETASCENLCQLDILTFLLASVKCAASSAGESIVSHTNQAGRPALLPARLVTRPLCTPDQEEWWDAAFKFCSGSAKENFSRLRRTLIRGIEVVRLKPSHGMSIKLLCHLARCLDTKVKSLNDAEFGCRCSASELAALEARALFYWQRAYDALRKVEKNQQPAVVKNRMFKEAGDGDVPPHQVDKLLSEADYAVALSLLDRGQLEDALERFERHSSPTASFHSARIFRKQALECLEAEKHDAFRGFLQKARDALYKTLDRLGGAKSNDLNFMVNKELDELEIEIQGYDVDEVDSSTCHVASSDSFYTPTKSASDNAVVTRRPAQGQPNDESTTNSPPISHSTPWRPSNGVIPKLEQQQQHRPSPERLESQIRSLGYSQTTLFKTVLDRNEELVMMHSRVMEEHRNHNNQLQTALSESTKMMEELKEMLVDNKDALKNIMTEISNLKTQVMSAPPPPAPGVMPPGPPLIMAPPHLQPQPHRGPYPGFPHQQPAPGMPPHYPGGYLLNSPMAPPPQPPPPPQAHFRPGGGMQPPLQPPGLRVGQMGGMGGKCGKPPAMMGGEDDDHHRDEDDDLEHAMDEFSSIYPEYFQDPSYSQYFTPDSQMQEWSMRSSGMDPSPGPLSVIGPGPSRMPMPQPGYFASAVRGQALQYGQPQSPQVGPMGPTTPKLGGGSSIGPGIFSSLTDSTDKVKPVTPPTGQGNIPLFSAMSGLGSGTPAVAAGSQQQPLYLKEALASVTNAPGAADGSSEDVGHKMGFKILYHVNATLPARNDKGAITILLLPDNNRATVVMMSDSKKTLFQHDVCGLRLQPDIRGVSGITWTASPIGQPPGSDNEMVTVFTVPDSKGSALREALQNALALITPQQGGGSLPTASITSPASYNAATTTTSATSGAKTVLGGFSFSSQPVISPASAQREIAVPHKGPTSPVKTDAAKPFAGFSLSTPQHPAAVSSSPGLASQALSSPQKSSGDGPERVDEYEPNVDFKPLIPLPELVEKNTGEENETVIFVDRCRLYRYEAQTSQWKERGVGEMKILGDNKDQLFRIVMRRDQIFKLCANHSITASMKLCPMASSDKTWCYSAVDYSEEQMKVEQLAVRFKNAEKADRFKEVFNGCVAKVVKDGGDNIATGAPPATTTTGQAAAAAKPGSGQTGKAAADSTTTTTTKLQPFSFAQATTAATKPASTPTAALAAAPKANSWDLFKPKPGSWECEGCLIRSEADTLKCPACGSAKPVSQPAFPFALGEKPSGFTFGSLGTPSQGAAGTSGGASSNLFGGPSAAATASKPTASSLSELFKPKADSWECDGCLCRNRGEQTKCPACGKANPNAAVSSPAPTVQAAKPTAGSSSLSELFKPKADSWECDGCLCCNQAEQTKCPACGKANPNAAKTEEPAKPAAPGAGSFTFGSGGGFVFGAPPPVKPSSTTTTNSGFAFGGAPPASVNTAPAPTAAPAPSGGFTFNSTGGFNFGAANTATPAAAPVTPAKPTPLQPSANAVAAPVAATKTKTATADSTSGGGSLLANLLTTAEADAAPAKESSSGGFNFTMTPGKKSFAPGPTTTTSAPSSGFQFTLGKNPAAATPTTTTTPAAPAVGATMRTPSAATSAKMGAPCSPEVDDRGLYVTKDGEDSHIHFEPIVQLPDKVETKTGEEEEQVLFESRARMYRFMSGEWKEKGVGVMKILKHKQTHKARVLMRRDQVFKICCNHIIKPDLDLQPMPKMEGKAWLWFALDFSEAEGKVEQLAIRFKKPETATEFKDIFDGCKKDFPGDATAAATTTTTPATTSPVKGSGAQDSDDDVIFVKEEKSPVVSGFQPASQPKPSTAATTTPATGKDDDDDDDDVVFLREEEATPDQKAMATKYQLPVNFYLYETRKPCKGCLGCTDGEGLPPFAKKKESGSGGTTGQARSYADAAKSPTKPTPQPSPAVFTKPPTGLDSHSGGATPKSIFGTQQPAPKSIFGSANVSSSPSGTLGKPLFGGPSKDQAASKSIFGTPDNATSSSSPSGTVGGKSIFGTPDNATSASSSPFGSASKSIFGAGAAMDKPFTFGTSPGNAPSTLFGAPAVIKSPNTPDFSSLLKDSSSTNNNPSSSSTTTSSSSTAPAASSNPFSTFTFGAAASNPDFSSLAATSGQTSFIKKNETSGPFKFHNAGQKLFGGGGAGDSGGAGGGGGGGDGEDDVAPSSDPHFEPIIPLPELVEVKTGEEDWDKLFCHRAKSYKFDKALNQWKERGVGDFKIMGHVKEVKFRVLQRREQVLKLSCNHLISKDMTLNPMSTAESAWCWVANDLSEETPSVEQFAVKFKNKEIATKFKAVFEDCQEKLKQRKEDEVVAAPPAATASSQSHEETTPQRGGGEEAAGGEGEGEYYDDEDEDYEDVDDDDDDADDEEDDVVILEKRITLSCYVDSKWQAMGIGQLRVTYNEDLNGNAVSFIKDDGTAMCSHIICREHEINLNAKAKSCEWKPIDYSTGEAIRRHYGASFSSLPGAEEFAKVFMEGKRLAVDSDLSEILPTDIEVPEVFSSGEVRQ